MIKSEIEDFKIEEFRDVIAKIVQEVKPKYKIRISRFPVRDDCYGGANIYIRVITNEQEFEES